MSLSDFVGQVFDGKTFSIMFGHVQFVKLTNETEKHNDFTFETGLNVDTIPFNPNDQCEPGGMYFTNKSNIPKWLYYSLSKMCWVRYVSFPDDAQVYIEENKCKSDKFYLGERMKIKDLDIWKDKDYCMAAVQQNGLALEYVKDQTPELCMAAVQQNG